MLRFDEVVLCGRHYLNFWAPVMHLDRELTFGEKRAVVKTIRMFEMELKTLRPEFNPVGWATWVEHDHVRVANIVKRLGGRVVETDQVKAWYAKGV